VAETADHDDVLATEADDGRELAHPIVDCPRISHGLAAEYVLVEDRDRVRHARYFFFAIERR
jgi:hypothetical protein